MKKIIALTIALVLTSCTAPQKMTTAPGVKVGKPYSVAGQTYYPAADRSYDETGVASWYGPGFHGNKTASGEKFDQAEFTAAHRTLPMPSIVRVTNTENGSSIIVRVNDRGPFSSGRIIDLSKASAQALGINGTAKVRVQYLADETEKYWAKKHLKQDDIQFAKNDKSGNPRAMAAKPSPQQIAEIKTEESASVEVADEQQAESSQSQQATAAAPILYVETAELKQETEIKPENLKIRPLPSKFQVISDAEAAESSPEDASQQETVAESLSNKKVVLPNARGSRADTVKKTITSESDTTTQTIIRPKLTRPGNLSATKTPTAADVFESAESSDVITVKTPKASASAKADGGSKKWYIQAGSFSSEANAQAMASRLNPLGTTDTSIVNSHGKQWHRVRLGPFIDNQAAQMALQKAKSEGATGAWIVRE